MLRQALSVSFPFILDVKLDVPAGVTQEGDYFSFQFS